MKYIKSKNTTCKVHIADKKGKALCGSKIKGDLIDNYHGKVCQNCVDRVSGTGFGRTAV